MRPGHALRDHHFDRALSNVDDTEHRHIRQANQHLAHASSVDNHRSPPADDENTASMAGPCAASADSNLVATPRRPNRENLIGQIRGWKHILNTLHPLRRPNRRLQPTDDDHDHLHKVPSV